MSFQPFAAVVVKLDVGGSRIHTRLSNIVKGARQCLRAEADETRSQGPDADIFPDLCARFLGTSWSDVITEGYDGGMILPRQNNDQLYFVEGDADEFRFIFKCLSTGKIPHAEAHILANAYALSRGFGLSELADDLQHKEPEISSASIRSKIRSCSPLNLSGSNLEGIDVSNLDLRGFRFLKSNLRFAHLTGSSLSGSDFTGADLSSTSMSECRLEGVRGLDEAESLAGIDLSNLKSGRDVLRGKSLAGKSLKGAKLGHLDLSESDLSGCDFTGADLSNVNMSGCRMEGVRGLGEAERLDGIDLSNLSMGRDILRGKSLAGKSLKGAKLGHLDLSGCDFTGADLSNVNMSGCRVEGMRGLGKVARLDGINLSGLKTGRDMLWGLEGKSLRGSKLGGLDLSGLVLKGCDFTGADLSKVNMSECTLEGARGLDKAERLDGIDLSSISTGRDILRGKSLAGKSLKGAILSGLDLSGCDFTGADLSNVNMRGCILEGAKGVDRAERLDGIDLSNLEGDRSILRGKSLAGKSLKGAILSGLDLRGCNFTGADLSNVNMRGCWMNGVRGLDETERLDGINLSHLEGGRSILRGKSLTGKSLKGANLHGLDLRGCNFTGADLSNVYMSGCILERGKGVDQAKRLDGIDLSHLEGGRSILRGKSLTGKSLKGARLHGLDLRGCDFTGADLSNVNMRGCILEWVRGIDKTERLDGIDLSHLEGDRSILRGTSLTGKSLKGARLSGLDLRGCNFTGADLSNVYMSGCILDRVSGVDQAKRLDGIDLSNLEQGWDVLRGKSLTGKSLKGANLHGLDLSGCDFTGADLSNVNMSGCRMEGVRGLT